MKLKELAYIVHRTLDEHQDLWGEQVVETQYLFTQKDAEKYFAFCGELDETEIERLGEIFWSMDIDTRDFAEIARAAALCIEARCANNDDRKEKKEWLDGIKQRVLDDIVNKLNRRKPNKKAKDTNWKIGEFNKFEFIQNYGHCYDSEEEANTDANDKTSTCPLLMSIINSGWLNLAATEDKTAGKIAVSRRRADYPFNALDMLSRIQVAFDTILEQKHYNEIRKQVHNDWLIVKLKTDGYSMFDNKRQASIHLDCDMHELIECLEDYLFDETRYAQSIYDFKTINRQFMSVVKNFVAIMDNLDETQDDIAKQLVSNTIENMESLSNIECHIVKEQHERDASTGKFKKEKFDTMQLIYTDLLDALLFKFVMHYDNVMRIQRNILNGLGVRYCHYCRIIKTHKPEDVMAALQEDDPWSVAYTPETLKQYEKAYLLEQKLKWQFDALNKSLDYTNAKRKLENSIAI